MVHIQYFFQFDCSHLWTGQLQIFLTTLVAHFLHLSLLNRVQLPLFIITLVSCFLYCHYFLIFVANVLESFFLTGNIQGLHNVHGSFSVPNMPGTLGSRNTAINNVPSSGVQQSGNSLSGGRFASNNIPVALSQVCVFVFVIV